MSAASGRSRQDIGLAIRIRRKNIGLSQNDLAAKLGISQSAIVKIEKGALDISRWPWQRLEALRRALKWTPEEFYEATGIRLPIGSGERMDGEPDKRLVFEATLVKSGDFTEEEAREIADMIFENKPPSRVKSELLYRYNRFILDIAGSGGKS